MAAHPVVVLVFELMLLTSWVSTPVMVMAFAPALYTQQTKSITAAKPCIGRGRSTRIGANGNENEEDPLLNDQREGMADAFAALDGLTADDFDDLRPLSSSAGSANAQLSMEELAKYQEMQQELDTRGQEGVYGDILGDLSGDEQGVFNDADGLGTTSSTYNDPSLTTADVSNDILTQDIQPSLSMDEFMTSAIQEAVEEIEVSKEMSSPSELGRTQDIAKTAEELLENEELRREIEQIFDRAGEKLRLEVEAMKREQEAVTQGASQQGLEYLESERQRISEAEESVTRLIQKVARETDEVQKAMEDLELARNQASGGGGSGSIEDTALDLKKGGIIKQASLVGGLLFGSRAITETILVLGSPYGDQHFVPAIVQAAIALACAAYFFLVK